jgi:hypothetical protein
MLPGYESVPVRVTHGLGAVTRADLRQHVVDVAFHCRLDNHVDLTGLKVGSPSLEDAYLALTSEEGALNRG